MDVMSRRNGAVIQAALPAFAVALFSIFSVLAQAPPAGPTPETANPAPAPKGIPVTLDGEVLYQITEPQGAFTKEERAEAAARRIHRMAEDPFYSPDLFEVRTENGQALVYYKSQVVGVVTAEDAETQGKSTEEVAADLVEKVKEAIKAYHGRRLPQERLRGEIAVGIATLILVVVMYGLVRLRRLVVAWVEAQKANGRDFRFGGDVVLKPEHLAIIRRRLLGALTLAAMLGLVAVYLGFVFKTMPLTRGYAVTVLSYLLDPLAILWKAFLDHIGNLFFILVVVAIVRYLLKALKWLLNEAHNGEISIPGVEPTWAMAIYKLTRIVVVAATAIILYPYIPGSDSGAFKGISIFAGALFTLGASGATQNFIGGFVLIFARGLKAGDRVRIGSVTGDVVELTLIVTRLKTIKSEIVTLPNSQVLGGEIVNYSALARKGGLILHTSVTIGYDAPWRRVHELLIQAALKTKGIEREPAPFVLQTALNDFFVTYEINAHTRDANAQVTTYSDLHQNIQDAFNEGGVEIMSPHYTSVRDGNAVTIPEGIGSADRTRRSFPVRIDRSDREGK